MDSRPVKDILLERIDQKGISPERISKSTGIPENYIIAFLEGNNHRLPSAPYIRGYLSKISQILELDPEELWHLYKSETKAVAETTIDKLPVNRFIIRQINKKYLIIGISAFVFLLYFIFSGDNFRGQPTIEFINPTEEITLTANTSYSFLGHIKPGDNVAINNEPVFVQSDGSFQKNYTLNEGLNTFEFSISRFLGKQIKVTKQIIYQPEKTKTATSTPKTNN